MGLLCKQTQMIYTLQSTSVSGQNRLSEHVSGT